MKGLDPESVFSDVVPHSTDEGKSGGDFVKFVRGL